MWVREGARRLARGVRQPAECALMPGGISAESGIVCVGREPGGFDWGGVRKPQGGHFPTAIGPGELWRGSGSGQRQPCPRHIATSAGTRPLSLLIA